MAAEIESVIGIDYDVLTTRNWFGCVPDRWTAKCGSS
jgi:hypothetical protein